MYIYVYTYIHIIIYTCHICKCACVRIYINTFLSIANNYDFIQRYRYIYTHTCKLFKNKMESDLRSTKTGGNILGCKIANK